MKLNNAQKVLLKFVAISQLYVALAVLVLVVYGAAIKLAWETSWMFVLATFLVCEAATSPWWMTGNDWIARSAKSCTRNGCHRYERRKIMCAEMVKKNATASAANDEMSAKDTREFLVASGISIVMGIVAYVAAWFVNPHISYIFKPGLDPVLAAMITGGAGLLFMGLLSFPVYAIIEAEKGSSSEELDLCGKVIFGVIAMGFALAFSTAFANQIY